MIDLYFDSDNIKIVNKIYEVYKGLITDEDLIDSNGLSMIIDGDFIAIVYRYDPIWTYSKENLDDLSIESIKSIVNHYYDEFK